MTEANDEKTGVGSGSAASPCSTEFHDAMLTAFNEAADGVEAWEYGGAEFPEDFAIHRSAAAEVAKRVRAMAVRYDRKHSP
ncbi:MAG: hypothetical protein GY878_07145 [Fuerstiella sp.]|nr:hypothetical protein [Fuerstiella sp.]